VPLFLGDWHGTWQNERGAVEVSIDFEKTAYCTREAIPGGVAVYGRTFGGIKAEPAGTACFRQGNEYWRGIYRVEGSRVRLCFSRSGARPTGFGVTANTIEWLIEPTPAK
jgi:hypothetical protein